MKLSKQQKFLYSRIAILAAHVGWISSAFAGLKGFPFWYGGFVLFFWLAFGLINYPHKTSFWVLLNRKHFFFLLYFFLAGTLVLVDQMGLASLLWFYPYYRGLGFVWVYLVLYPFAGLAVLELFYFLVFLFGEKLSFEKKRSGKIHTAVDAGESVILLAMIASFILGAIKVLPAFPFIFLVVVAWVILAMIKLFYHISHDKHFLFLIILGAVLATLAHELPNTVAFEWVYFDFPILMFSLFSIPLWVFVGWFWFILLVLRFWIYIVLHPRVR